MNVASVKIGLDLSEREAAYAIALSTRSIRPRTERFQADTIRRVLRAAAPLDPFVSCRRASTAPIGPLPRWDDIIAQQWTPTTRRSPQAEGIALPNLEALAERDKILGERRRGGSEFASMDPPDHGPRRKAVSPTLAAPATWPRWRPWCASAPSQILDSLPDRRQFDWVDRVSKELAAMTLPATLFDFPLRAEAQAPPPW